MPYEVRRSGSKFAVTKKGGGKVFGKHESQIKALKQLRAIYANSKGEHK